jgi:ABC-type glycerol-3-phosphate transport system permease component
MWAALTDNREQTESQVNEMATTVQTASSASAAVAGSAAESAAAPRARARLNAGRVILYVVLVGYGLFSLAPFLFAILSSFKNESEVLATPPTFFPNVWTTQHYQDIFSGSGSSQFPFPNYLGFSLAYAIGSAALNVVLAAMAGYAFGRMEFPGKNLLFALTLAVLMIPGYLILIPKFVVASTLGLTDSAAALIVPAMVTPISVFLMTQFLKTLPRELEESAMIDGASRFRTFWQIILPLVRPVMIAVVIFQFQGAWNDFAWPLLVMSSNTHYTLTVGLEFFKNEHFVQYGLLLAGATINIAPLVLIFFIFQRYFLKGISTSGLAGR